MTVLNKVYKYKAWIVLGICAAVLIGLLTAMAKLDQFMSKSESPEDAPAYTTHTIRSHYDFPTPATDVNPMVVMNGDIFLHTTLLGTTQDDEASTYQGVRLLPRTLYSAPASIDGPSPSSTPQPSASPKSSQNQDKCRNKRGVKIGQIIVGQPNVSSIVMVGSSAMVTWNYTPLVKNFPKTLWTTSLVLGLNVSQGARGWYYRTLLKIVALNEKGGGAVVPDGKETAGKRQGDLPCFFDGDALPGSSAIFKISRTFELDEAKDRFPPSTSSAHQPTYEWSSINSGMLVVMGVMVFVRTSFGHYQYR
ncbi:hypothetical protein BC829DRAFT_421669 [Chytridium lagenaria]|nr:hypothetical protein BC829DRAFT_421669 [Chytridium lagenaria]